MKIIKKKYKIIILGDSFSGKTFLINTLKNKQNNLSINYYPTNGINFYKYYNTKTIFNNLNQKTETHTNILYLYDASGNKNKQDITKQYIKECQICLIVINPNNYLYDDNKDNSKNKNKALLESLNFWINLYINNNDKEASYLILICINNFKDFKDIKNLANLEINLEEYLLNLKYIKNIFNIGVFNFKIQLEEFISKLLKEIHNGNILDLMTKSNIKIENNIKKKSLYFKKEINYNQEDEDINETSSLLNNNQIHKIDNCFIS